MNLHKNSKTVFNIITDPMESAKAMGLSYVTDKTPGISRKRFGKSFIYFSSEGQKIRKVEELKRLKALAIPPAWEKVWICSKTNGHLQATGLDSKGRKQYRYHVRWRETREETKYARMMLFGQVLPQIRSQVQQDLAQPKLTRDKVIATLVQLLEKTLIRIGNEEYVKANKSYGLTTMRNQHVKVAGSTVKFKFRGKSGIYHEIGLHDRRLAKMIKRLQDLPGQELFQYLDEEEKVQSIDSADVNEYLHRISGQDFTAKDFRTWAGTVLASLALREFKSFDSQDQAKKNVLEAIEQVAKRLGNTPAICRKCYIHPALIEAYIDGSMLKESLKAKQRGLLKKLEPEEVMVMRLLQQHSRKQ